MALVSRIGNMLKQASLKHINIESSLSNLSVCQAVRRMSSSKLFVGGLPYSIDERSLGEAFAQHGDVIEARIIVDQATGRSRGFGFVSYTSSEDASRAKNAMDGQDLQGRTVKVDFATERPRQGGFGGGNYGGGNSYGGGGNNYGGGYGNYGDNVGSYGNSGGYGGGNSGGYGGGNSGGYGGGNSGGYGGGNSGGYGGGNGGGYGVAGTSESFSAVGGSSGEFGDAGFSGTEYGGTTGNESFSVDGDAGGVEPIAIVTPGADTLF